MGWDGEEAGTQGRKKELGSHLNGGMCCVSITQAEVYGDPAGPVLVQDSIENEKGPMGRAKAAELGEYLPPPLLPAWPEPRGTSSWKGRDRERERKKKVTADVRDIQVGGKHNLTYIQSSICHTLPYAPGCPFLGTSQLSHSGRTPSSPRTSVPGTACG